MKNKTTTTQRVKQLFPKFSGRCGSYTCGVRFLDEARGERYFDTEWAVHNFKVAGVFTITRPVDGRGRPIWDSPASNSLGHDLRAGDTICIAPVRWNMRGRRALAVRTVKVVGVDVVEDGFVQIKYQ